MAADAFTPRTSKQRLPTPLNGTLYTTTRIVAQEKPLPVIGGTMAAELGPAWEDSIVIAVSEPPENAKGVLTITHVRIPSEAEQLASNWEQIQVGVGGGQFPGIIRSVILPAAAYQDDAPAIGSALPVIASALFDGDEYILYDRECAKSGSELEPSFRVDRRTYIRRLSISAVKLNDATGRANYSSTRIHHLGEVITGTFTIEQLAAAPANPYWGLQADGVFRELTQLSEDWFLITEANVLPAGAVNSLANPAKTRVIDRVTPLGTDVVFTEIGAMPGSVPAYGSAHYDAATWPNHKLALIAPADETGLLHKFTYVADRATQDVYNFTSAQADIGGRKFDSVERSYIVSRSMFVEGTVAMGAAMPDVPANAFGEGYVLSSEEQTRTGDPQFDNLYVTVSRSYVRKVTLGEIGYNEATGRSTSSIVTLRHTNEVTSGAATIATLFADKDNAYWGLQPGGVFRTVDQLTANWFAVTERSGLPESPINSLANPAKTRVIDRVTPLGTDVVFTEIGAMPGSVPAYGSAHYDATQWPNHKLLSIEPADASGLLYKFTYAADRPNQDTYNWEAAQADIGGVKFNSVLRTYITPRASFNSATPAQGATMPNVPVGLFSAGYVLASRKQTELPEGLRNLYVGETLEYVQKTTIRELGVDPLNGRALHSITTLYYATEIVTASVTAFTLFDSPISAYWGLQSTGYQRTGKQLTAAWYSIEEAQVIGGTMVEGVLNVHDFYSNDNYYWPPVLETYELLDWERRDGSFDRFPAIRFSPEGYNGPCRTQTVVTWSPTPFNILVVNQMQPTRVYYASPFFTVNIPECLHGQLEFECDIGTTDTTYDQNLGSKRYFAATNEKTWPPTIIAFDDQQPFRGGYLRTVRTVSRPPIPAQVGWTSGLPLITPPIIPTL